MHKRKEDPREKKIKESEKKKKSRKLGKVGCKLDQSLVV